MSALICGRRLGFEEVFGSPGQSSAKKIRYCAGYVSPIRSADFGFGSDDKASILFRMFPSMELEVVSSQKALRSVSGRHPSKIEN